MVVKVIPNPAQPTPSILTNCFNNFVIVCKIYKKMLIYDKIYEFN